MKNKKRSKKINFKNPLVQLIYFTICLFLGLLFLVAWNRWTESPSFLQRRESEMQLQQSFKIFYARTMYFETQFFTSQLQWFNDSYFDGRSLIFVQSENDFIELGYCTDTIVAWPSVQTQNKLKGFNELEINLDFLYERGHTLKSLELSLPLTIEDVTENWVNVWLLMNNVDLSRNVRISIE